MVKVVAEYTPMGFTLRKRPKDRYMVQTQIDIWFENDTLRTTRFPTLDKAKRAAKWRTWWLGFPHRVVEL